jgi:hypothetical protein
MATHRNLGAEGVTKSNIVFCLSFANLMAITLWSQLFMLADPRLDYYRRRPADVNLYIYGCLEAALGTVALTFLFMLALRFARASHRAAAILRAAACALLMIPVRVVFRTAEFPAWATLAAMAVPAIAGLFLLLGKRTGRRVASFGAAVITILWPLMIVMPAGLLWRLYSRAPDAAFSATKTASFLPQRPGSPRVIWVVFDELDQELLFPLRPGRVHAPEFDRLRSQSLYAEDALPTSDHTGTAIPALTTGRLVKAASAAAPNQLHIVYTDGRATDWAKEPHIFGLARASGHNVGLVGWHHPYCRLFADCLSGCEWEMNLDAHSTLRREHVVQTMPFFFFRVSGRSLAGLLGGPRSVAEEYRLAAFEQRAQLWRLVEAASEFLLDSRYGFLMFHFPVPHLPAVTPSGNGNYFDNIAEADAVLGQLRRKLESAGMWDSSSLLVMGDHHLRFPIWNNRPMWTHEETRLANRRSKLRVPFLLKMPGQQKPVSYPGVLNTIVTHDLILDMLRGRLRDAGSAMKWIEQWQSKRNLR